MFRHCWLFLTKFLLLFSCFSQSVSFEYFSTADGLAGNLTTIPVQDKQGLVWFVNSDEILRHDGRNFHIFPNPFVPFDEFPRNILRYEDSLLLSYSHHHLFILNPRTFQQSWIPLPEADLGTYSIYLVSVINGNSALVNLIHKKEKKIEFFLCKGDHLSQIFLEAVPTIPKNAEYDFTCTPQGEYILFFKGEMFKWDVSGNLQLRVNVPDYDNTLKIRTSGQHRLFLSDSKVYTFDEEKHLFNSHQVNRFPKEFRLEDVLPEENGSMWLCGTNKYIAYYDARRDTLYDYTEIFSSHLQYNNDFVGMVRDQTGLLWLGSFLGLAKVRPQNVFFDSYLDQANPACDGRCSLRGIEEDQQGNIYVSYYGGVDRIDLQDQGKTEILFKNSSPFDLYMDETYLWLNTGQRYHLEQKKLENPESGVVYIYDFGVLEKDVHGNVWLMTSGQLFQMKTRPTGYDWIQVLSLSDNLTAFSNFLYFDTSRDQLWFSMGSSLYAYGIGDQRLQNYGRRKVGHNFKQILCMEADSQGILWMGTDNGLLRWNPEDESSRVYTIDDGLPNNFICGMLPEGDSCLWLSTNYGLSRFQIRQEKFINFFEEDGLTLNEFNRMSYFQAKNGQMFFGGMQGLNAFFPKKVMEAYRRQNSKTQMVLSSFEHIDEKRDSTIKEYFLAKGAEIHLHHWDKSFSFEYTLTDFSEPQDIYYSYLMEGYEKAWSIPSSNNFSRFTSLPPGSYTFRVKARDHRGNWHPSELAIKVRMHPAWWESMWAYVAYVLLTLGLIGIVFRFMRKRLLLQSQLRLEQQEASRLKELDHFKSRLFTNLTHEFRTPLTVILGMAQQIKDAPGQYARQGAELISRNGKGLLQLINQLLDLSKLENHAFQLHLQQGDIIPYLRYLTESYQTYADGQNLSLQFFSSTDEVVMDYDPEQIKQIISNLISNAIKFTPSGGRVSLHVEASEKQLQLEVRDTGIGIAAENLAHVFDRFYQVESDMTRLGEGTGIGLAHSQELVRLMGGEISVRSEIKQGSCFRIMLPIQKTAEAQARQDWLVKEAPDSSLSQLPLPLADQELSPADLPQLLIIEDNPDVVIYLQSCLKHAYQLDIAYNGKIGIEKAIENIPDLIISDVMMPEKDGFEVCDTLKQDERTSHIPFILLTAKADAASKLAGLKRGADAYLAKPFDREELLVRLEIMLAQRERIRKFFSQNPVQVQAPLPAPDSLEADVQIEHAFLQKIMQIVSGNYQDESFGLAELCRKLGMSRSQLFRKMKAISDSSPAELIRKYRLNKARELLESTDRSVSDVCWDVGFKNLAHFSKAFQEEFGLKPSSVGSGQ